MKSDRVTVLDHYAAAALGGLLADPKYGHDGMEVDTVAFNAFNIAEAMMVERAARTFDGVRWTGGGATHEDA